MPAASRSPAQRQLPTLPRWPPGRPEPTGIPRSATSTKEQRRAPPRPRQPLSYIPTPRVLVVAKVASAEESPSHAMAPACEHLDLVMVLTSLLTRGTL